MAHWKHLLGRVALSTASLTIIASLGGFLGAIFGALFELMLQALAGVTLQPLEVIPLFVVVGLALSLVWGLSVLVQNWPQTPEATR
jgi:hypothetical protein